MTFELNFTRNDLVDIMNHLSDWMKPEKVSPHTFDTLIVCSLFCDFCYDIVSFIQVLMNLLYNHSKC